MTEGLEAKGIPPEKLVNALIEGIKKNRYTIRVGDTKLVYMVHRFFPKMAYGLINAAKNAKQLQS